MVDLTDHQLQAALWQARLLDEGGSDDANIQLAHRLTATEGMYPAPALADGHALLVKVGLVKPDDDGLDQIAGALAALVNLDDETALDLLRRYCERALHREKSTFSSEEARALVGSIGEELVAQMAADELCRAGRADLAQQVQRVSLIDDSLGYDVQAPMLTGGLRLMEVKASSVIGKGAFRFFLSRNEYDVGLRNSAGWALVACNVGSGMTAADSEVVGWTPVGGLKPYLPEDGNGRWNEALVRLPRSVLNSGLPPIV